MTVYVVNYAQDPKGPGFQIFWTDFNEILYGTKFSKNLGFAFYCLVLKLFAVINL